MNKIFRTSLAVFRLTNQGIQPQLAKVSTLQCLARRFSALSVCQAAPLKSTISANSRTPAVANNVSILKIVPQITLEQPKRTVIKFSLRKGKRKTVKAVIKRFKRLDWGGWIRTRSGRNKKIWRKSLSRQRRLRQHVFVNSTQSWMLDKMVTKFWRRPKYYVDDPYSPYHRRDEFFATRRRPIKN